MGQNNKTHNKASELALLGFLVIQNTTASLLARYTMTKFNYDINHMLVVAEVMKLIASIFLEFVRVAFTLEDKSEGPWFRVIQSFRVHIWDNPGDAIKLVVPSGLYYVQNFLSYYSVSILPIPLLLIAQQTKLVPTALLSVIVFKRKYTCTQWCSILALCIGSSVCIYSSTNQEAKSHSGVSIIFGIMLVILSHFCSSVASVYFEAIIKGTGKDTHLPSIWMRNIQLATFTLIFLSVQLLSKHNKGVNFFYDFTPLLWVQISIFACGGLLVASVVKYTDSVRKGLANGLAVFSTSALSMMIEPNSFVLKLDFILGSILTMSGCFFFTNPDITMCKFGIPAKSKRTILGLAIGFCVTQNTYETYLMEQKALKEPDTLASLPDHWKQSLHVHVRTVPSNGNCGGCMVLDELIDAIASLNITTSGGRSCPTDHHLRLLSSDPSLNSSLQVDSLYPYGNKTFVFVYPEGDKIACTGNGNRVHVHWILATLGVNAPKMTYRSWGEDDLVFNYASACAVHPKLLPRSNILQVITSPKEGDEFDLPPAAFLNRKDRRGTLWTMRKGNKIHKKIDYGHKLLPEPHTAFKGGSNRIFLQFEYFFSYDPYTFYTFAAGMLGAISVVHPIANTSKQDWLDGTYVGEYLRETGGDVPGVAYGWTEEEIKYANSTMKDLREFMLSVREWGRGKTVERFAKDCYRYGVGERKFESALLVRDAYTE